MARAGSARFRAGETLYLVEDYQLHPVQVLKGTGVTPLPELVQVREPNGSTSYLIPLTLHRDRAAAEADLDAQLRLAAARQQHGRDSNEYRATLAQARQVWDTIRAEHPYSPR